MDSRPEKASHELANPTRTWRGPSETTDVNCAQTRRHCSASSCTVTTVTTTRLTTSDATARTAVRTADSWMPMTFSAPSIRIIAQAPGTMNGSTLWNMPDRYSSPDTDEMAPVRK